MTKLMIANSTTELFEKEFGSKPAYKITVPSRVNLIGEHMDYFDSFVLPMAIDNVKMTAFVRPRQDNLVRIHTQNLGDLEEPKIEFTITDNRSKLQWVQYIQGAIAMFAEEYGRKNLKGFDLLLDSTIPIGGGLSSSSALTMTSLAAMGIANKFTDDERDIPSDEGIELINKKNDDEATTKFFKKLCMMGCWAEYWYGTRGGAMDHFATTVSKMGYATFLDNRSFDYKYVPVPQELAIIVCNTMVRHNQLYSGFKVRKDTALGGFEKLKQHYPEILNVRDLSMEQVEKYKDELTDIEYKRLKHPITEKDRVFNFIEAISQKKFDELGKIINQAFASLQNDYEVSCDELDIMQEAAVKSPGCYGARLTGGGFGGCIVAFVDAIKKEEFMKSVKQKYDSHPAIEAQNISCDIWQAHSGNGLTIENL